MQHEEIQALVEATDQLVSFPAAAAAANKLIQDEADLERVAEALSQDPALAAQLLKVANSAYYGLRGEVSSIKRAIQVLGLRVVQNLVLGGQAAKALEGLPNELVSFDDFWPQAIQASIAARELAKQVKGVDREAMFMAGLLHNVGLLVLFHHCPKRSAEAQESFVYGPDDRRREDAEVDVFGFHQADVGAALMAHWHFPDVLVEAVRHQLSPGDCEACKAEAALLQLASAAALMAETNAFEWLDIPPVSAQCFEFTGLEEDQVIEAARIAATEMDAVRQALGLNSRQSQPA